MLTWSHDWFSWPVNWWHSEKKKYNTNQVITDLQVYNDKNKSYKQVLIKLYGTRKRNVGMHIILL